MKAKKICILSSILAIFLFGCATTKATGTGETLLWKDGFRQTDTALLNKDITIFARLPNVADGTKVKITINDWDSAKTTSSLPTFFV